MSVPHHRYRIRELSEEDTEWLVSEVYGSLPSEWDTRHWPQIHDGIWEIAGWAKYCLTPFRKLNDATWGNLAFRAFQHLRNIGVVEATITGSGRHYKRHALGGDPLLKPSRAPCVRAATALVDHATPVDDTHVSVPHQMMRGLLSGALVR